MNMYKYLTGVYNEHEARLFLVLPSDGTKGSVHKLEHRTFPVNVGKHFFSVRLTELGTDYPQIS